MDANLMYFSINDLRNPRPTTLHRMKIKHHEDNPVDLTEESILASAAERTGLDDFGESDFRTRLRNWLEEVNNDPKRTEMGRAHVFSLAVRFASARLHLQHLLRRHPEIHELQIQNPIFILGPPRSGTTHLLNLLATDSRLRSLPLWESAEPFPAMDGMAKQDPADSRYARYEAYWKETQAMLPYMDAIHPGHPDQLTEDIELQGPDFAPYILEWSSYVRPWYIHSHDQDQTPHYEYMRTMLKALQWQRGPDRWVLKSPQHSAHIPALLATFPDATVVMTHRDPVAVIQSICTYVAYAARLEYDEIDLEMVLELWTRRVKELLSASMRDRNLIPPAKLVDVFFQSFMHDELHVLKQVHSAANIEPCQWQMERAINFLNQNPREKYGRLLYHLESNFGVTPSQLREEFDFYCSAFPVANEL